jgi:hypothetical protein
MARKFQKLITLVLVSAFLLAGFGEQVHAIVLCFGADGHSALEKENNGHCNEGFSEDTPEVGEMPGGAKALMQGEISDPCLDFCLSHAGESVRKTHSIDLSVSSLPATCFQGFRAGKLLMPKLSLSDIPPPYRAAVALRYTILLI